MSGARPVGSSLDYEAVGVVDTGRDEAGLGELGQWVRKTFDLNVRPLLPLGYFANVVPLTADEGVAISTDGVGTKILVAEEMGVYDTIGIDCVAMNANDVICVGARPLAMVDYIGLQEAKPAFLGELAKGLHAGAEAAGITIPGGEIAQIPEMITGVRHGYGFDLVGTCIGRVPLARIIVGADIQPRDVVVGITSSGVHSNGFTLTRRVLERAKVPLSAPFADSGHRLGEELLIPTRIYVKEVVRMLDDGLALKALIHVTSTGFLNLTRVKAEVGYVLDALPEPQPIFPFIQKLGAIEDAEMFRVYNMGVGFGVIVAPADADAVIRIARAHGHAASVIGFAVSDPRRRVWLPQRGLVGENDRFTASRDRPPVE